eukprot:g2704.t1
MDDHPNALPTRSSRAIELNISLQEVLTSRASRLSKAESVLGTLKLVADEVGVYGHILQNAHRMLHDFIFCNTEYSVVVPPEKVKTMAKLHARAERYGDSARPRSKVGGGGTVVTRQDLTVNLETTVREVDRTKEMLDVALEQRQMVLAEKDTLYRKLTAARHERDKDRAIVQELRKELQEERREAAEKNEETIRGQALVNREIITMQSILARNKDHIKQLEQYRAKVEGVRVTFKMFGNEGSGDYQKYIEPKRSIAEIEMLALQLKKLYDDKLAQFEEVRWDSTKVPEYKWHAAVEFGGSVTTINNEMGELRDLLPTLGTASADEKAKLEAEGKNIHESGSAKASRKNSAQREDVFGLNWEHPVPSMHRVNTEMLKIFQEAYSTPDFTIVSAKKGMAGGTNYEKYMPTQDFVEQHFIACYGGNEETGHRAFRAYAAGLKEHKDSSNLLRIFHNALVANGCSHTWRAALETKRVLDECEEFIDFSEVQQRRQFLKKLYVGDVPVSDIFQLIDRGNAAYTSIAIRIAEAENPDANLVKTPKDIMLEWICGMLVGHDEPRVKSLQRELVDRDLSMKGAMRLETFQDACLALLPGTVERRDITRHFRSMAYESMTEHFGAVNPDTGESGAFARLMARPVKLSLLASALNLLKLNVTKIHPPENSNRAKHGGVLVSANEEKLENAIEKISNVATAGGFGYN